MPAKARYQLTITLSEAEDQAWRSQAERRGLTLTGYLRWAVITAEAVNKQPERMSQ